jgi:nucleotide-binding universal stress UspA family protein
MKRILVPCDFSGPSMEAFKLAAGIASKSKGEIYVLNVVEMPVLHSSLLVPVQAYENSFLKDVKERATRNFTKMKDRWAKKIKVGFQVEHGVVVKSINNFVARKKIDLVVMGTHGSSGVREFALGSNAEKVVRSCKVPVVSVHHTTKTTIFKDLILPVDLDDSQIKLLATVKPLQAFFKAKLHILYVNSPTKFERNVYVEEKLQDFVQKSKIKNYTINIYNDLDAENGIINFSKKFKTKMVAMSTHGRKGLAHLLSGSVAEDVVNHLGCPIWTYVRQ